MISFGFAYPWSFTRALFEYTYFSFLLNIAIPSIDEDIALTCFCIVTSSFFLFEISSDTFARYRGLFVLGSLMLNVGGADF